MELKYRRTMRMPINYLPGFVTGTNGMAPPPSDYVNLLENGQLARRLGLYGNVQAPTGLEKYRQPVYNGNSGTNWSNIKSSAMSNASNIILSGLEFGKDLSDAFHYNKSVGNILNEQGYHFAGNDNFGYQKINDVDFNREMSEVRRDNNANTFKTAASGVKTGAAIGSVAGPVGTAIGSVIGGIGGFIGGLFGGAKRRREAARRLEQARVKGINTNTYNMSSAQSDYLTNDYYNTNGTTQDDLLYAKRGKDSGYKGSYNTNNSDVLTSVGKVNAKPNARVAAGESIIDNIDDVSKTTGHVVKTGKVGKDTNLANLNDNTIVFGQDVDWRNGATFRDQSLPYTLALEKINKKYENRTNEKLNKFRGKLGQDSDKFQQEQVNKIKQPIVDKLKDLSDQQALQHQQQEQMYTQQDLPGFTDGKNRNRQIDYGYIERPSWLSNAIPMGIGALTSIGQYLQARNQSIHTPDIYAGNPYERAALQEQAKLRVNPYEAIKRVYDQDRVNRYEINRAGGLSGAQKYLANVALGLGTQQNIADTIQKAQETNNQYRGKWAEMAANLGNALAQRRQQANQYNTEYAASAHAARQQGMQMGLRNFMDYIQQYAANEYKRKTGNGMLSLYQQKVDMDRENMRNYYNKDNRDASSLIVPTQPIAGRVVQPTITNSVYNIPNPGTIKLKGNPGFNNVVRKYGIPTMNIEQYNNPQPSNNNVIKYVYPNMNVEPYSYHQPITNFSQIPLPSYWNNNIIR